MTRLRSVWAELKSRAFPPGAITFHLGAWSRGALSEEEGAAARALLGEVGAERLLVLHGSAIRLRGETVVVVGPPAIGKSTACGALVLREGATWLEDGLVVAAESCSCWTLIETGTLAVLRHAALFAAGPRRFLGRPGGRERGAADRGAGGAEPGCIGSSTGRRSVPGSSSPAARPTRPPGGASRSTGSWSSTIRGGSRPPGKPTDGR